VLNTHEPTACEGQPCCIHNPTDHHMATWPKHWRADRYLGQRIGEWHHRYRPWVRDLDVQALMIM
jgi:hypothetical protein